MYSICARFDVEHENKTFVRHSRGISLCTCMCEMKCGNFYRQIMAAGSGKLCAVAYV